MSAVEVLKDRIRLEPTPVLLDGLRALRGRVLGESERMVRACLLDVYQEREGEPAVEALLDELGQ